MKSSIVSEFEKVLKLIGLPRYLVKSNFLRAGIIVPLTWNSVLAQSARPAMM